MSLIVKSCGCTEVRPYEVNCCCKNMLLPVRLEHINTLFSTPTNDICLQSAWADEYISM